MDFIFLQLSKLYDLSEDEERRNFLDKYLAFMSVNGEIICSLAIFAMKRHLFLKLNIIV